MENQKAGIPQAIVILAVSLLPMLAIVTLMPIVPVVIQNFKNTPNIMTLAPLAVAAPGLCVAIFSPFAGYLTDKLGRRKLLLIFTFLYGIGGVLPFFINDFSLFMTGRLLLGIGEAFVLTVGNTLNGDYYEEKTRANLLMWQSVIGSACGTLFVLLSSKLATIAWNYPFLIYSLAFLITVGTYLFIFEPKVKNESRKNSFNATEVFPLKIMIQLAVMTLIAATLYFVYTLHISLALNEVGVTDQEQIGNYTAIASIAVPIGGFLFRFVANKSGLFQFACLFTFIGLGLIGIGSAINIQTVVLAAWVQQLGAGMAIPVLIAWGLNNVPAQYRGRGMGFWGSGFFLGQFCSPLLVSGVRNLSGSLLNAFMILGIVCLILAIGNWFLSQRNSSIN